VVERTTSHGEGRSYPITASATLITPYAVPLTASRKLSEQELRLLDQASLGTMTAKDWIAVAKQIRRAQTKTDQNGCNRTALILSTGAFSNPSNAFKAVAWSELQ